MTPFGHLIFHFLKRMFSGEEEEGVESMSLGLGVVLAFLSAPGALASLFLINKYSTLLQLAARSAASIHIAHRSPTNIFLSSSR